MVAMRPRLCGMLPARLRRRPPRSRAEQPPLVRAIPCDQNAQRSGTLNGPSGGAVRPVQCDSLRRPSVRATLCRSGGAGAWPERRRAAESRCRCGGMDEPRRLSPVLRRPAYSRCVSRAGVRARCTSFARECGSRGGKGTEGAQGPRSESATRRLRRSGVRLIALSNGMVHVAAGVSQLMRSCPPPCDYLACARAQACGAQHATYGVQRPPAGRPALRGRLAWTRSA